jgi:glycosyltransferase involved in cell wall biosynthesis
MHLSVVIPTFNRAGLLGRTIPALMRQETGDFTYEVIFVSNGSSDATETVLTEAAIEYQGRLRYFSIAPTGGPSAPRNVGIRAAAGEVVVILDDDVLPDPALLRAHAEFHRAHPDRQCATIGELYVPADMMDDPISLFHTFPYDEVRGLDVLSYLHFWTCNVSFKREFMLECGMFDESFLYYEDILCGYRLAESGMSLHFAPKARGQHLHQLKSSGVPAKAVFTGRWLFAFLQKVPDPAAMERFGVLSRDLPFGLLARRVLGRLAFRLADNAIILGSLRLAGATGNKRGRLTDLYYEMIFRHHLLAGYYQAKREAPRRQTGAGLAQPWIDRGES